MTERSIVNLPELCDELRDDDRALFDRLFQVGRATGRLVVPPAMVEWVEETYGSLETVSAQPIVKVTNIWSLQTSLFNPLRAQRPQKDGDSRLSDEIYGDGPDPFDTPEDDTSADTFGRMHGEHVVTASNLAKSDVNHGVIVFNEHNPWLITEDALWDAIQVAGQWLERCHAEDATAFYPFILWNCLWKSGASISHAHMQLLVTRTMHYGRVERLRRLTEEYARTQASAYFDDLYSVHAALGLGRTVGRVRMFAQLTPLLANEIVLISDRLDESLVRCAHQVIRMLNEELGVTSFNLVIVPSPLGETPEDWSHMPVMARIVDRGNPLQRTIDTGALELFAASVVSADPFIVGQLLDRIRPTDDE